MMEKFELCFPVPDGLVVPELMTEQEAEWKTFFPDLAKCLRFELHYDFLPEGLVPRFLVATHDLSKPGERWRSGVILREGGNVALVRGDAVDRRVSIAVTGPGPTKRDLLSSIRREFTKIHRSISALGVKEMVPVPGLDVEPIAYDHLVAAECATPPVITWNVVAEGKLEQISIARLLNGIEPKERRKPRAGRSKDSTTINVAGNYIERDTTMGNTYNVTGQGNAVGKGNTVTNTNSFNTGLDSEALVKLFTQLNGQLAPLKDEMKGKDFKVVEEHIEAIKTEAVKPEPDKSALAVSGRGLIEAATTVGAIATPVLTTVGLILKLCGVTLP